MLVGGWLVEAALVVGVAEVVGAAVVDGAAVLVGAVVGAAVVAGAAVVVGCSAPRVAPVVVGWATAVAPPAAMVANANSTASTMPARAGRGGRILLEGPAFGEQREHICLGLTARACAKRHRSPPTARRRAAGRELFGV